MSVLFNTYPMAFHTPGGGEIQLQQYRMHLERSNLEVSLLNLWEPDFKKHDLVHFFSCMSGSLHFCAFVKSIGMPLVVSPNLWITEQTKSNYPADEIRTIFVLADRVVCNSNAECDQLAKVFNIERERFVTVYNGIANEFSIAADPKLFREIYGITGQFVLNVANIEPRKNQLNLIRALKYRPDLTLVQIGGVRDEPYFKACSDEGGAQFKYIGPLPHNSDALRSAYAGCSVFALPSVLETPGLAAIEAFAGGVPIVVTGEGCAREYFGTAASYVDHDDIAGISAAIETSLSKENFFLAKVVASANFSWGRVIKSLIGTYDNLRNRQRPKFVESGFHSIEYDDKGFFVWSKFAVEFDCEPGLISGLWRSVAGVTAELSIDDEIICERIEVAANWEPFEIVVPFRPGATLRKVAINNIVMNSDAPVQFDPRPLGIAIRSVQFEITAGADSDSEKSKARMQCGL